MMSSEEAVRNERSYSKDPAHFVFLWSVVGQADAPRKCVFNREHSSNASRFLREESTAFTKNHGVSSHRR